MGKSLKIVFLLSLLFILGVGKAQQDSLPIVQKKFSRLKNLGKQAERMGQTFIALEYYEKAIQIKPEKFKHHMHLADLYRYTRNYIKAEEHYQYMVDNAFEDYPEAMFYLATAQKSNDKYEEAKNNLLKFKKVSRQVADKGLKKLYKAELAGCEMAIAYKDSVDNAVINHLPESVNNPHIDFSPIAIEENKLVFGSLRAEKEEYYHRDSLDSVVLPVRKFYVAEKSGDNWEFKGEWQGPFNTIDTDVANGTFSLDSSRFYFTRCSENWQYKTTCKIYFSERDGSSWKEPELMNEQINLEGFTSSHPTIGRESKKKQEVMYFASDRPDGKGGLDIWYAEYNKRKKVWRSPRNAGTKLNSPGTETTPYYHPKTRTLYYSTNGKSNFGQLDIFKTIGEKKKWEPSVNLGLPINSRADDLDYAIRPSGKGGYFVSNRVGGFTLYNETCCDDIYEFTFSNFIELIFEGQLLDVADKNCIEAKSVLRVYILDGEDKYMAEEKTLVGCDFDIQLQPGFDYVLETTTDGYFSGKAEVSTKEVKKSDTLRQNIEIDKMPAEPIVLKDIYYEFNSPNLTDKATAAIDTTLLKILNDNPEIIVEIASHTDNKGSDSYNEKLSQKRAESVVKYLIKKGIPAVRLEAKGYGEKSPIAPNQHEDGSDNPEGRQRNRRTEFKIIGTLDVDVIHYDGFEDIDEDDYGDDDYKDEE